MHADRAASRAAPLRRAGVPYTTHRCTWQQCAKRSEKNRNKNDEIQWKGRKHAESFRRIRVPQHLRVAGATCMHPTEHTSAFTLVYYNVGLMHDCRVSER